jgi:hypothetical protein
VVVLVLERMLVERLLRGKEMLVEARQIPLPLTILVLVAVAQGRQGKA